MNPIQPLDQLYTDLVKIERGSDNGKIYLRVEGNGADRHVTVVTGFFSCLWARLATFFGGSNYQANHISEVLVESIRKLGTGTEKEAPRLLASTQQIAALFTRYMEEDRFVAEFSNAEAIKQVADSIIQNLQARIPGQVVGWTRLAKIEQVSSNLPEALKPHRDFLSRLLGAPIEELYLPNANGNEVFREIRVKVENSLDALDTKMSNLIKTCTPNSLEETAYSAIRERLQQNIRALKKDPNDAAWSQDLAHLPPLLAKYESFLGKLQDPTQISPLLLDEGIKQMWSEVDTFWKNCATDNATRWVWNRVAIPKDIHEKIARLKAQDDANKSLKGLEEAMQDAEKAGLNMASKFQELLQFQKAASAPPQLKAAEPAPATPKAAIAFDQGLDEVSEYLGLNRKGFVDFRAALITKFNEQYQSLARDEAFKTRGTMGYHLRGVIYEAFEDANTKFKLAKDDPIEEKKQLFHMLQSACEFKLLLESTGQNPSKQALIAKTVLLLRTVIGIAEDLNMGAHVPFQELYAMLPLAKEPPYRLDMEQLAQIDSYKMKTITKIVESCLQRLQPLQESWTRDKCQKVFESENPQLFEDARAALHEARLSLLELQLIERVRTLDKESLEAVVILATLNAARTLKMPYNIAERDALNELFSLTDRKAVLLTQAEILLKREPRDYGRLLFEFLEQKAFHEKRAVIDFEKGDRDTILKACRTRLTGHISENEQNELERVIRRISPALKS